MGSGSGERQYPDLKKAVEENSDKRENDAAQELVPLMASTNQPSRCSRDVRARRPHRTHSQQTILAAGRNRSRPHPWVRPKAGHAGREAEAHGEESRGDPRGRTGAVPSGRRWDVVDHGHGSARHTSLMRGSKWRCGAPGRRETRPRRWGFWGGSGGDVWRGRRRGEAGFVAARAAGIQWDLAVGLAGGGVEEMVPRRRQAKAAP